MMSNQEEKTITLNEKQFRELKKALIAENFHLSRQHRTDLLKENLEEIRSYIISTVEEVIDSRLDNKIQFRQLEKNVQGIFKTALEELEQENQAATDREPTEPGYKIQNLIKNPRDSVWIESVDIEVLDEGLEYTDSHLLKQKGKFKDLGSKWKSQFTIFKKSEIEKLEFGKKYRIGPIVSSVFENSIEFHLNSKTSIEVIE